MIQRLTHAAALRSRSGSSLNIPSPVLQFPHSRPRKHSVHTWLGGQQRWSWSMCQKEYPGSPLLHTPHVIISSSGISSSNLFIRSIKRATRRSSCERSAYLARWRCLRFSNLISRASAASFGTHGPHTPLLWPRFGVYMYGSSHLVQIRSRGSLGRAARESRCRWLYATRPLSLHSSHIGERPILCDA